MKKRIVMLAACLAVLASGLASAGLLHADPNGFRGIKWGTRIDALPDMQLVSTKSPYIVYQRANENMKMGDVPLDHVYYIFSAGIFVAAVVDYPASVESVKSVQDALISKYGTPGENGSNYAMWNFKHNAQTIWHGADTQSGHIRYEISQFPDARSGEQIGLVSGDF